MFATRNLEKTVFTTSAVYFSLFINGVSVYLTVSETCWVLLCACVCDCFFLWSVCYSRFLSLSVPRLGPTSNCFYHSVYRYSFAFTHHMPGPLFVLTHFHPFIHPSIHLYIHPSLRARNCTTHRQFNILPFIQPFIRPSTGSSMHQSFHPSTSMDVFGGTGFRVNFPIESAPHISLSWSRESSPVNFRPVSNLTFISKVLERIANKRLTEHLSGYRFRPRFLSADIQTWPFHRDSAS